MSCKIQDSIITNLVDAIKSIDGHDLADNLICNLIAPFVDDRHVDVVNKKSHALPAWRTVCSSHAFLDVAFDSTLETIWR